MFKPRRYYCADLDQDTTIQNETQLVFWKKSECWPKWKLVPELEDK